jgi:hypothetical protein
VSRGFREVDRGSEIGGGGTRGRSDGNMRRVVQARMNWTNMCREVVKSGKWKSR